MMGDASARIGELFDRHFDAVYRFLYHRVGRDAHAAADLAQETFLRALRALPRFEDRGLSPAAWLTRIALNLARDRARRASFGLPKPRELAAPPSDPGLLEALDDLPPAQRTVVLLKLAGGHTDREAAETLGRSEAAVKALYVRALRNLRKEAAR